MLNFKRNCHSNLELLFHRLGAVVVAATVVVVCFDFAFRLEGEQAGGNIAKLTSLTLIVCRRRSLALCCAALASERAKARDLRKFDRVAANVILSRHASEPPAYFNFHIFLPTMRLSLTSTAKQARQQMREDWKKRRLTACLPACLGAPAQSLLLLTCDQLIKSLLSCSLTSRHSLLRKAVTFEDDELEDDEDDEEPDDNEEDWLDVVEDDEYEEATDELELEGEQDDEVSSDDDFVDAI